MDMRPKSTKKKKKFTVDTKNMGVNIDKNLPIVVTIPPKCTNKNTNTVHASKTKNAVTPILTFFSPSHLNIQITFYYINYKIIYIIFKPFYNI